MINKTQRCLITFESPTVAQKAHRLLREKNIHNEIVSLEGKYTKRGCKSGLSLSCTNTDRACEILINNKIRYSDVVV
ncbi:MAG: DUF3343 domain-containing protein [Clostridia bacterium]|nr:DUF3343 domain-containing protein [Clostridia bacterium]